MASNVPLEMGPRDRFIMSDPVMTASRARSVRHKEDAAKVVGPVPPTVNPSVWSGERASSVRQRHLFGLNKLTGPVA